MKLPILQEVTKNFEYELQESQKGTKNSLSWLTHTLAHKPHIQNDDIFQVITIGGTFFRNALLQKEHDQLNILSVSEGTIPLLATKEIFFHFLLSQLHADTTYVAMNFGFPLEAVQHTDLIDGILVRPTKEHAFTGLVGETVGATFAAFVKEQTGRDIRVSLTNDTICLLLSGLTQYKARELAAGIVGTGFNMALFANDNTLINLEAGNFDKFKPTVAGKHVDTNSGQKQTQLFEKEISGGFLYQHFNYLLKEKHINHPTISTTKELSEIAERNDGTEATTLAQELLAQSAQLVGAALAALANMQQKDLIVVMQGSLFWKGYMYKETVDETVKKLTRYQIVPVDILYSDILGAAKLVA